MVVKHMERRWALHRVIARLNLLFFLPPLKAFGEYAWANMGQKQLKAALDHLFEHPKYLRNKFGKSHFGSLL